MKHKNTKAVSFTLLWIGTKNRYQQVWNITSVKCSCPVKPRPVRLWLQFQNVKERFLLFIGTRVDPRASGGQKFNDCSRMEK
jgi:hypothetical protein